MKKLIRLTAWLIPVVVAGGCGCGAFDTGNEAIVGLELHKAGLSTFEYYNLSVKSLDSPNYKYEGKKLSMSEIDLPVNLNRNIQTFILKTDGVSDTLTFGYRRREYYEDGCGYRFRVDSLFIAEPTTLNEVKIKTYQEDEKIVINF